MKKRTILFFSFAAVVLAAAVYVGVQKYSTFTRPQDTAEIGFPAKNVNMAEIGFPAKNAPEQNRELASSPEKAAPISAPTK